MAKEQENLLSQGALSMAELEKIRQGDRVDQTKVNRAWREMLNKNNLQKEGENKQKRVKMIFNEVKEASKEIVNA